MALKIAIACGGTGGHLFPGIAVSKELKSRGHETLLLVSSKQIDVIALQGSGEESKSLSHMGFPGIINPKIFEFILTLWKSWKECKTIYQNFIPDVVLGMGGFTSAVPLMLGKKHNKPTLIHDSNAIPGRVTRLLSKRVSKVLVGFENCANYLPNANCITVGTPVRQGLVSIDRKKAAKKLRLSVEKFTILVMGGSQGAKAINEAFINMLSISEDLIEQIQILHITGQSDYKIISANYNRLKFDSVVIPFSSEMQYLYSIAHIVIARSGASSLNETAHYGLPSILIPYPFAADNHQIYNAQIFEQKGAAKIIIQSMLTAQSLKSAVLELMKNDETREAMAKSSKTLAGTNAASAVADEIEKCCKK